MKFSKVTPMRLVATFVAASVATTIITDDLVVVNAQRNVLGRRGGAGSIRTNIVEIQGQLLPEYRGGSSGGGGKGKGKTVAPSVSVAPSAEPSVSNAPSVSSAPTNKGKGKKGGGGGSKKSKTAAPSVSAAPSVEPSVSNAPSVSSAPTNKGKGKKGGGGGGKKSKKGKTSAAPSFTPSLSVAPSVEPSVSNSPSVSSAPSFQPSVSNSPSVSIAPSPSAPPTIVDIACSTPEFSTLCALVVAAGLADTLSGPGPFTVFAPTNDAFDKFLAFAGIVLPPDLGNIPPSLLDTITDILLYHVVGGTAVLKVELVCDAEITTARSPANGDVTSQTQCLSVGNGQTSFFQIGDATAELLPPQIILFDVLASNGVIHGVNNVILPA